MGFWMVDGGWSSERRSSDQKLGIVSPVPYISRRERGTDGVTNSWHLHLSASIKSQYGFGELPGWLTHAHQEGDIRDSVGKDGSRDPPRPCPMCLFIWLFICVLYCIFIKMVYVGKYFPKLYKAL